LSLELLKNLGLGALNKHETYVKNLFILG